MHIASLLLGKLLSQQLLLRQFPHRGLRQACTDFHLGWHLVFRELVGQEGPKLVDPKRRMSRLECDEGLGRLPAIGIRDADDSDLSDAGVLVNRLFNVARETR